MVDLEFSSYPSGDGDHRPYQAGAEDFPRSTRTGDGTRPHRSRIGSGELVKVMAGNELGGVRGRKFMETGALEILEKESSFSF